MLKGKEDWRGALFVCSVVACFFFCLIFRLFISTQQIRDHSSVNNVSTDDLARALGEFALCFEL